jgi:prepilin peptidase CpaA
MPPYVSIVALLAFPALLIVAALRDATSMTIPNWISIALAATFAPAALVAGLSVTEALACLGVGVATLAIGVGLFALRWIGGGDAKLLAGAALWLGLPGIAPFLLWTALAGGALALVLLGTRRLVALSGLPAPSPAWLAQLLKPEGDIPYGIAIATGALAAFAQSPLTQAWSG